MKKLLKFTLLLVLIMMLSISVYATEANKTDDSETEDTELDNVQLLEVEDDGTDADDTEDVETAENDYEVLYGDKFIMNEDFADNVVLVGNLYVMGDKLNIAPRAVIGNVYAMGETVTINTEEVTGSVYAMGNNVDITIQRVDTTIYAGGSNVKIESYAYNIYAMGDTVEITESSATDLDLRVAGNKVTVGGYIVQNIYSACDQLTLSDNTYVGGNIEYVNYVSAPEEFKDKLVKKEQVEVVEEKTTGIVDQIRDSAAVTNTVTCLVVLIIIGLAMPKSDKYSTDFKQYFLKDIARGFAALVIIPILSVILLITVVGIPAAIIVLVLYILTLAAFTMPVATMEVTKLVLGNKINSKIKLVLFSVLAYIVLEIVGFIPYVGSIVHLVLVLYGFGYIIRVLFFRATKKEEVKTEEQYETEEPVSPETLAEEKAEEVKPEVLEETAEEPVVAEEPVQEPVVSEETTTEPVITEEKTEEVISNEENKDDKDDNKEE